jgi:hypothetical protein
MALFQHHKIGGEASIFNFSSASVDEELESTVTLWRYCITKVIQIANE